ncbi:MAG: aminotransferase class III-fold pyridoxal phosphate-dependent enzyme [Chloroflexota bacterium]
MREAALRLVPGGVQSNVRLDAPQVYFERGEGARLWDVDGNDYLDYLLGQGPCFLGQGHPVIAEAVARASRQGMVFGAQNSLEVEAADRFLDTLGWAERVRFGVTGTEMVQLALRIARAATGRRRFIRFAGHYHGWLDTTLLAMADGRPVPASRGQLPEALDQSIVLQWNDATALEAALAEHGDDVAAVIMEPMMFNTGSIAPLPGYLEVVRAACTAHGVVLIFDEVISGFRVALGGAVERFGVTPDLATYGKAMAGGWPASALAGRAELMDPVGTGAVNHSGTFNGNVMACAATIATLDLLASDPPYERLAAVGGRLMTELASLGREAGLPLNVQGLPMAFNASIGGPAVARSLEEVNQRDREAYVALARALVDAGVWVAGRGIWYLSAAHDDDIIDATLERARPVLLAAGAGG